MHVQTKFLRLCKPVVVGDRIDDWRVSWLGGWDKCQLSDLTSSGKQSVRRGVPSGGSTSSRLLKFSFEQVT
jgi:hypothetical protein